MAQHFPKKYQAHTLIITAHVEYASRETLSATVCAEILDRNTVFCLYLLEASVNPLDADNGLLLCQEAMLIGIFDTKGFIAILDVLHVIVIEFDFTMLLGLVLNDLDNVLIHEVFPP